MLFFHNSIFYLNINLFQDTFEDLDIETSLECGSSGSYAALAKTLDDLAGIVEEVGIEKLSKELGIDLDFITL